MTEVLSTPDLLATPEALADFRKVPFDPKDYHAIKMLEVASDFVRAESGQYFTPVDDDEVELIGNWTRRLWLPQRPVLDVTSVSIRYLGETTFQTIAEPQFRRDGLVTYFGGLWAGDWDSNLGCDWGGPEATVRGTYSHGSRQLPAGVESIVLAVAARRYPEPAGTLSSETMMGYSYTRAVGSDGEPILVTTQELNVLANIRAISDSHR